MKRPAAAVSPSTDDLPKIKTPWPNGTLRAHPESLSLLHMVILRQPERLEESRAIHACHGTLHLVSLAQDYRREGFPEPL